MSLTLLLWPSAKVHPAVLVLVTCFPAIPTADFEFSVCSLVPMISHHLFHLFLFPFLCQCQWNSLLFLWEISSFPLSESSNIHRIISVFELSTLDPAWVQRTLLLQRREQLLLSTFDTYPTVTVGVDSVARVLQGEALPTPPS